MSDQFPPGSDCRDLFRSAYLNRYTWNTDFPGYKGRCKFTSDNFDCEAYFELKQNSKPTVENIDNTNILKAISSQLWEVAIHRVRRSFDEVHGANTFTAGDVTDRGVTVIVGGKNKGDKYCLKENIVTMVYRNIHGVIINIHTNKVQDTGKGYLSKEYTSRYYDPQTKEQKGNTSIFIDTFNPISKGVDWVLADRIIESVDKKTGVKSQQRFSFIDLTPLD